MRGEVRVEAVVEPEDFRACLAIRREVFVREQGVALELEEDGLDERCEHFAARLAGTLAATARLRQTANGWKIERVAVSRARRGQGVGRALVGFVLRRLYAPREAAAGSAPRPVVYVNAQVAALPFWFGLGFEPEGERFEEAGIQHQKMRHRS